MTDHTIATEEDGFLAVAREAFLRYRTDGSPEARRELLEALGAVAQDRIGEHWLDALDVLRERVSDRHLHLELEYAEQQAVNAAYDQGVLLGYCLGSSEQGYCDVAAWLESALHLAGLDVTA